jgi:hypothetical protein
MSYVCTLNVGPNKISLSLSLSRSLSLPPSLSRLSIKVGDKLYISSVGPQAQIPKSSSIVTHLVLYNVLGHSLPKKILQEVTGIKMSQAKVRYILTEHDTLVVNGVVASVYSTAARSWETLPFRVFDSIFAGGAADKRKLVLYSPCS